MSQDNVSECDYAYQYMIKNLKPNLRQYPLDPREAIETYHAGGFIFSDREDLILEPYRDGYYRRKYSLTIAAFLLGLPLPDPIIATRTPRVDSGVIRIVSGYQSLLLLLTYFGCDIRHNRSLHSVPIYPRIENMEFSNLTSTQVDEIMGMRSIPITFVETEHNDRFQEDGIYGAGAVSEYYWMWNL